jgi:uncharacterized protein
VSNWQRLMIYVGEADQFHGKPVYLALVEAARQQGLAGATVFRGVAGFGKRQQHRIQTTRILELFSDLPMMVTIIDQAEAIANFLPQIKAMVQGGIVTQEAVNVVDEAAIANPSEPA